MSTLHTSEKTHPGMLPQSQALESTSADNPGVGTKRGVEDGQVTGLTTGVQHGRGETPGRLTNFHERHTSPPEQSGGEEDWGFATLPSITAARVFVLDRHGKPLMPCHAARARKLLRSGRARVHRLAPFVIRLVDREVKDSVVTGVEVGIDPGSRFTGICVFRSSEAGRVGLVSMEIQHQGHWIHKRLKQRSNYRRRRRTRNLRYRAPRFNNRTRREGWLAPSLRHRVDSTMSMVTRICRWAPVVAIHQELVRSDTQRMENPEITGIEYQQGTLYGYDGKREYLLENFNRTCAYCGTTKEPFHVDHIVSQAKDGTNRVSNLVLACKDCNESKGKQPLKTWLVSRFGETEGANIAERVLAQKKSPLQDAAAVNSTRQALYDALDGTDLPVFTSPGWRTKWNRSRFGVPKTHTLDALCVGEVTGVVSWPSQVIIAEATGRGRYARTMPNKFGFPRLQRSRIKQVHGFQTGDLVRAVVSRGNCPGIHVGRVSVRTGGSFVVETRDGKVNTSHKNCRLLQRNDGWSWSMQPERGFNAA
jgi:5-methylcytosine-specific restriction endonuclease McrA